MISVLIVVILAIWFERFVDREYVSVISIIAFL